MPVPFRRLATADEALTFFKLRQKACESAPSVLEVGLSRHLKHVSAELDGLPFVYHAVSHLVLVDLSVDEAFAEWCNKKNIPESKRADVRLGWDAMLSYIRDGAYRPYDDVTCTAIDRAREIVRKMRSKPSGPVSTAPCLHWLELELRVKKIVSECFNIHVSDIQAGSRFVEDLGADQISLIEFYHALDDEFDLSSNASSDLELAFTVHDVCDYVIHDLRKKSK